MLLKAQRNQLFQEILKKGLQPTAFAETSGGGWYRLTHEGFGTKVQFEVCHVYSDDATKVTNYKVNRLPGHSAMPDSAFITYPKDWGTHSSGGVFSQFLDWLSKVKREAEEGDLWLEATKAIQLFETVEEPAADKFTIAELGALHGQLRMLGQLFENSELLQDYQAELAELAQTAAVKAEMFTKKDWQNWVKGAFVSVIVSLELSEEQAQELLALVRLAFGGLFLKS